MPAITRLLGIRPGEGRLVALVAACFASIEAGRGIGEVGADTLAISRFGASILPVLFIGLGATSLVAALAYGAALGRAPRARLFSGLLLAAAATIAIERLLLVPGTSPILLVLWLTVYAAGTIAGTIAWTLAGAVLDARQAKRLFPLLTSAAIAGMFAGTLGSGLVAGAFGAEALVVVAAALLVVSALLIVRVAATPAGRRLQAAGAPRPIVDEVRAGFDEVRRTPLLRLVAVAYVVFSVLHFAVTFPFLTAMRAAFPSEAELAGAIGVVSAAVTATSFVVSLVVAPRLYARLGVATSALLLPLVYVVGFALWIVQFSTATAVAVRFAQQVTQRGVSNAAWSAFYNVVPAPRRAQTLAFMDGVPGQLGIALSGVLLLAAGRVLGADQVFWVGAIAAVVCTLVVIGIRRVYGMSLLRTLQAGTGEQMLAGGPGLAALAKDAQVSATLVKGLAADLPAVRAMAARLLGRLGDQGSVPALAARLDDPDPGVRAASIDALAALASPAGLPEPVRRSLARFDDPDPTVRRSSVRALGRIEPEVIVAAAPELSLDPAPEVHSEVAVALIGADEEDRPHALLVALLEADDPAARLAGLDAVGRLGGHAPSRRIPEYLADPSPRVRAGAVRALAAVDGSEDLEAPFVAALDDDALAVRQAAAAVLRDRSRPATGLLEVLDHGRGAAQEAALAALEGHVEAVREPLVAWADRQVGRAATLRRQRLALEPPPGAKPPPHEEGVAFLVSVLSRREASIENRLLTALGLLGVPEAGGIIRRCLRSNDADTRAQAIEALDSLGDGRLRRGVVALLEDQPGTSVADRSAVIIELAGDPDGWIRALALRARAELLAAEWSSMVAQAKIGRAHV